MKNWIFAMLIAGLPIAARAQQQPAPPSYMLGGHSIFWFRDQPDERRTALKWCDQNMPINEDIATACLTAYASEALSDKIRMNEIQRRFGWEQSR